MTAAHHLTAVLAVGVARLSPANRISADLPNAASIVAIERRPPNVDIIGPVSANSSHSPMTRRRVNSTLSGSSRLVPGMEGMRT
jgi:hypothetical protein